MDATKSSTATIASTFTQNSSFLTPLIKGVSHGKNWIKAHPYLTTLAAVISIGGGLAFTHNDALKEEFHRQCDNALTLFGFEKFFEKKQVSFLDFSFITSYFSQKEVKQTTSNFGFSSLTSCFNKENFDWTLKHVGSIASAAWNGVRSICTLDNAFWSAKKIKQVTVITFQALQISFRVTKVTYNILDTIAPYLPPPFIGATLIAGAYLSRIKRKA